MVAEMGFQSDQTIVLIDSLGEGAPATKMGRHKKSEGNLEILP